MPKISSRTRYFAFPHNDLLFDARLEAIHEEPSSAKNGRNGKRGGPGIDIIFDFFAFTPSTDPEPYDLDGRPHEVVTGEYRPLRLRFTDAQWLAHTGAYEHLDALPDDEHARVLLNVTHARDAKLGDYFWVGTGASEGSCNLRARGYRLEEREGERRQATVTRRWAQPPSHSTGRVPHRPVLYRRFAGDPIDIHLDGRLQRHRLFIGGLHHQRAERPSVDHVLNLCGVENQWVAANGHHPADRFLCKGEMSVGMGADELLEEATWVVDRLREGHRVLVHCYAGINRSGSVCCAALMLLEGITANEALARIRERHPSAWPDPYHWFTLLRLSPQSAAEAPVTPPVEASVLRA